MESRQAILEVAQELLSRAGFSVKVAWDNDPLPRLCVTASESLAPLIGAAGQHLHAVEHLVRLVAAHRFPDTAMPDFFLDIGDYQKTHLVRLCELADAAAKRVRASGHSEALAPMNAHERKIVHTKLSTYPSLETQSVGIDPNRRIIIKAVSF